MTKKLLLLFAFSCLIFSSCKDETEDIDLLEDLTYFPIEIGKVLIYDVDTTIYDLFQGSVYTISGEIREEIIASDTDLEGRPRVKIAHKSRKNSNQDWEDIIPRIWYAVRTENVVERVEENLRFVKLNFPITDNQKWAGNDHIDTDGEMWNFYDDWQYRYDDIGMPKDVGGLSYDNTITVIQNDYSNLQEKICATEIYAKDVGLVYREFMNLTIQDTQLPPAEVPWPGKANSGEHIIIKLKSFE